MTEQPRTQPQALTNGYATAALVLGLCGFFLTGIPLIGFLIGGIPNILAIIFGIIGFNVGKRTGVGMGQANWGVGIAGVSILSMGLGAGTLW